MSCTRQLSKIPHAAFEMNSKWPETSKRCLVLPQFPIGSPQFVWGGKAFVVGLDWFQTGGGPTSKCWPEGNTPPADATTPTDSPAHTTLHLFRLGSVVSTFTCFQPPQDLPQVEYNIIPSPWSRRTTRGIALLTADDAANVIKRT
jgi:hypothetical protein